MSSRGAAEETVGFAASRAAVDGRDFATRQDRRNQSKLSLLFRLCFNCDESAGGYRSILDSEAAEAAEAGEEDDREAVAEPVPDTEDLVKQERPYLIDPAQPTGHSELDEAVQYFIVPRYGRLSASIFFAGVSAFSYFVLAENTHAEILPKVDTTITNFFFYWLLYSRVIGDVIDFFTKTIPSRLASQRLAFGLLTPLEKLWHFFSRIILMLAPQLTIYLSVMGIAGTNALPLVLAVLLLPNPGLVQCWFGSSYETVLSHQISRCWQSVLAALVLFGTEIVTTAGPTLAVIYDAPLAGIRSCLATYFEFARTKTQLLAHLEARRKMWQDEVDLFEKDDSSVLGYAMKTDELHQLLGGENGFLRAGSREALLQMLAHIALPEKKGYWERFLAWCGELSWQDFLGFLNQFHAYAFNAFLVLLLGYASITGLSRAAPDLIDRLSQDSENGLSQMLRGLGNIENAWGQLLFMEGLNLPDICLLSVLTASCIPDGYKMVKRIVSGVSLKDSNWQTWMMTGFGLFLAFGIFPMVALGSISGLDGSWLASADIYKTLQNQTRAGLSSLNAVGNATFSVSDSLPQPNAVMDAYMEFATRHVSDGNFLTPTVLLGSIFVIYTAATINLGPLYALVKDFFEARAVGMRFPFLASAEKVDPNYILALRRLLSMLNEQIEWVRSPFFEMGPWEYNRVVERVELRDTVQASDLTPVPKNFRLALVLAHHATYSVAEGRAVDPRDGDRSASSTDSGYINVDST